MSKQKVIYFLSAIVLIIGCYILNLSYSLFVQTEEREVVSSVVPSLSSVVSIPNLTLNPNEEYVIKQTITNNGTASSNTTINYVGSDITVELVDKDNNSLYGTLEPDDSYSVLLYIKNNSENENTVSFNTSNIYTTLNNNLVSNISDSRKYSVKKSSVPYYDKENTLAYRIIQDYVKDREIEESLLTYEEIEVLTRTNDKLKLPIYNDNVFLPNEGNLYKTIDNDGISYYFKDDTFNNYVSFANKLWRIIRINGNGSVRLISDDIIDTSIYNNLENDNTYNGTIKEKIEKWYIDNLSDYSNYLCDEVYCVNSKDTYDFDNTLSCNEDNIYKVSNNKLTYPIATISYEEVVLAGLTGYLNDNIWTLTSYIDNMFFVIDNGKLITSSKDGLYGIKPVINVKSDVNVTGNGLVNDPYVISID